MGKRKGLDFERKIAKQARDRGLYACRIAASIGEFDVMIIDEPNKTIELIQCKKGWSYTPFMIKKEENKLKHFEGVYQVKTSVAFEE